MTRKPFNLKNMQSCLRNLNPSFLRGLTGPPLLVWRRPVTRRSGKSWRVVRRRACQARLVNAVYHWSRVAVQQDPISKAKYKALRARGNSHGRALRSVADRLLAIACAMLRDQTALIAVEQPPQLNCSNQQVSPGG